MGISLKSVRLGSLAVLLSVGSAGCSSSSEPASSAAPNASSGDAAKKEITVWTQQYGSDPSLTSKLYDSLTAKFKEKTGITVKYAVIPWAQALTKHTLASTGGEAPDVADLFFIHSFQKMGGDKYGPLQVDDLAQELGADRYYPASLSDVKVGEHFYGLPWRSDTRIMIYNTEHFATAGITSPPKTWEELVNDAQKLTQRDTKGEVTRAGLLWSSGNARFDQTWFTILTQAGGSVLDESLTKPAFDSAAGKESLQFMQDMVYKFKVSPKNVIDPSFDPGNQFLAGKASILLGVGANFKVDQERLAPQMTDKYKAALMPSKTGSGPSSVGFAAPISIMKTSKDIASAKEWVRFFLSEDVQLEVSKTLGQLNANKNVMEELAKDEWMKVFADQFNDVMPGDGPVPYWSQIDAWPDGPLPKMTTNIMAGNPIDDEVKKAVDAVNKTIAENQ